MLQFDWDAGVIRATDLQSAPHDTDWSIVVCGDWMPREGHIKALDKDVAAFYGDLLPILRSADIAAVNLECALVDEDLPPIIKDGPTLKAPERCVAGLGAVPFQLACLANNHTFDYGLAGLRRTKQVLADAGVRSIGAGDSFDQAIQPEVATFGKTRVAILNVAEGEEGRIDHGRGGVAPLDMEQLPRRIELLRPQVDVLIIIVHAGCEYVPIPSLETRRKYRQLIDIGADLVIGHHPHVPQGIEQYKHGMIAYSLGNFAFYMGGPLQYAQVGYCVHVTYHDSYMRCLKIIPYEIRPDSLQVLSGARRSAFLSDLAALSALIGDDARLGALWQAYADAWFVREGMSELARSLALIGDARLMVRVLLSAQLRRYHTNSLFHRIIRRMVWFLIHWLARHHPQLPDCTEETRHGAAVLRNRFDTSAHREIYRLALARMMDGTAGQTQEWARHMLAVWGVGE